MAAPTEPEKDAPLVCSDLSMEFKDISSEIFRIYQFVRDGKIQPIQIQGPSKLHVSASGGHRILTEDGLSFYVPAGWVLLVWKAKEGQPAFVM